MSEQHDGGPASPCGSGDMRDPTGLTIRQWYKGKAPPAHPEWIEAQMQIDIITAAKTERFIRRGRFNIEMAWPGAWADAMLAEDAEHAKEGG